MNKIILMSLIYISITTLLFVSCSNEQPDVTGPILPTAPSTGTPPSETPVSEVTIRGLAFEPTTMNVPVGATVTWYNRYTFPHTVTARDFSFGSGNISSGGTYTYTFTKAGTFEYYCTIHPFMEGKIVVG